MREKRDLCQSASSWRFREVSATAELQKANTSPRGIVIFQSQSCSPGLLHSWLALSLLNPVRIEMRLRYIILDHPHDNYIPSGM